MPSSTPLRVKFLGKMKKDAGMPRKFLPAALALLLGMPALKAAEPAYTDEQLWTLSKDPKAVKTGGETFQLFCASCHVPQPQNAALILKDNVWYYGGKPTEIFKTVTKGIPDKGMAAYGTMLGAVKTSQLVAFILSTHTPEDPVIPGEKTGNSTQTPTPP